MPLCRTTRAADALKFTIIIKFDLLHCTQRDTSTMRSQSFLHYLPNYKRSIAVPHNGRQILTLKWWICQKIDKYLLNNPTGITILYRKNDSGFKFYFRSQVHYIAGLYYEFVLILSNNFWSRIEISWRKKLHSV